MWTDARFDTVAAKPALTFVIADRLPAKEGSRTHPACAAEVQGSSDSEGLAQGLTAVINSEKAPRRYQNPLLTSSVTSPPYPPARKRDRLENYLACEEESPTARFIARQSQLPYSQQQQQHSHPTDDLTSKIVDQSHATTRGSLPQFGQQGSECTSTSVSTALGISALNRQGRLLEENAHGELHVPPRSGSWSLPCPCRPLGCSICYRSWEVEEWMRHILTHFSTNELRARTIPPPSENTCQYCSKKFRDNDPVTAWKNKMIHQTKHYEEGRSSLPDFELVLYLWKQGVITRHEFRDAWGPGSNVKPQHTIGEAPQEEEDEEEPRAFIRIHSRREGRHR